MVFPRLFFPRSGFGRRLIIFPLSDIGRRKLIVFFIFRVLTVASIVSCRTAGWRNVFFLVATADVLGIVPVGVVLVAILKMILPTAGFLRQLRPPLLFVFVLPLLLVLFVPPLLLFLYETLLLGLAFLFLTETLSSMTILFLGLALALFPTETLSSMTIFFLALTLFLTETVAIGLIQGWTLLAVVASFVGTTRRCRRRL